MPSESIAELPVAAAPTNFITAMVTLAPMAPKTASFEFANASDRAAALAPLPSAVGGAGRRLRPGGRSRGGGARLQLAAVGRCVRRHRRAERHRIAGGRRAGV